MSCIEVKTFRFKCDECKATVIVLNEYQPWLPEGWGSRDIHDCGMTGYTRVEQLCPTCSVTHSDESGRKSNNVLSQEEK